MTCAHTVVALELARCVDDRLTGDRKPHQISVAGAALDLEVAERLVALECPAVVLEIVVGRLQAGCLRELGRV